MLIQGEACMTEIKSLFGSFAFLGAEENRATPPQNVPAARIYWHRQ